ncbi:hypothetical protein FACS1894187_03330 [Synergistales bacterium]|nr:hypothetical protein FACS1894187_03330 [Synergistales bacterium]
MKKTSLLLISFIKDDCRTIGTTSLYANMKAKGIETKLLYINIDTSLDVEKFGVFLRGEQFGYIGISLMSQDYHFAVKLSKIIRKIAPNAFLLWGGIHPTCLPEESLDNDIDCIFIGEAENSLYDLISARNDNNDISAIKGIGIKKNERYILNSPNFVKDIDTLHFPYYDFGNFFLLDDTDVKIRNFTLDDYKRYSKHGGDGYTLMTSRSCPHSCSYCINSFMNKLYSSERKGKITMRRRSVKNTIEEIKYALENIPTVEFINFMDDHFLVGKEWLEEFYDAYPAKIGLPFIIRSTTEAISEYHIKRLSECGLQVVQMGIQSASERTHREIFNRRFSKESVLNAASLLSQYNIKGMYDFIIGNEFETDEEKESTIRLMMELPKPYEASVFHIVPFPKTDIIGFYKKITLRHALIHMIQIILILQRTTFLQIWRILFHCMTMTKLSIICNINRTAVFVKKYTY